MKITLLLMSILLMLSQSIQAQKKPVFLDTYDDRDASDWIIYGGSWSIEQPDGNEPHYTYKVSSGSFDKSIKAINNITDFIVEAEIKVYGGQGSILFNVSTPGMGADNLKGYSAGIDASGSVWLGKHNNNWTELARQPYTINLEQPYHVRVERQNSNIRVYVNGNLKISVVDTSFKSCSMIGVRGGAGNQVTFDNFIVRPFGDDVLASTFIYKNPIALYPLVRDAQIIKDGDRWYMTGTAAPHFFSHSPGVPLYSSKNLVDWKFEKYIIERDPSKWYSARFWAPELRKINNKYYLTVNCFYPAPDGPTAGVLAVADNITGPYTVLTPNGPWAGSNDGSIFQDTDGKTYLFLSGIVCQEVDLNTATTIGGTWDVARTGPAGSWDAIGNEGPYCIKREGIYYCFYSAWTRGYEVGVVTATNIRGPWTKLPNNPVFGGQDQDACIRNNVPYTQDPSVPYRAAGHNNLFIGPDGKDWIICHMEMKGAPPQICFDPIQIGEGKVSTISNNPQKATAPSWDIQTINLSTTPGSQTPYAGVINLPGTVEAENYDNGGEGVSYHDNEAGNLGAQYRTAEGVDIEACTEGGYDLGWTVAGEWQEYSVNVLASGTYKVAARVSCGSVTPGSFHIEFDGVNTSGTINAIATGDWQSWTNIIDTFNLTTGTHIMRVYYEKPDVNINNLTFTNLTATGTGNGLTGNYFNGMNFETPVFSRRDDVIQFDWSTGSPDASVNVDHFSARWTGQLQAKYTDTYTFYLNSDNGRRLWINGQLIIDKWIGDWGTEYTGTIILKAGQKYDIKLEYFEENDGANCKLEWSSPTQAREVVPKNQLYANQLPTVSITAPINNAVYTSPAIVTITGNANDADGTISKVEFYNGTTLLNTDNTAPYNYTWTNIAVGTYTITARAYDNANAIKTSTAVSIQVNAPANILPTVSITAPTNNSVYIVPASITITANANDADGSISKVEFYNGTTLLNTDAAEPYSYVWTNVRTGAYTITAKAYDNLIESTMSAAVNIQVNTFINEPPTVSITAPTNNAVYNSLASITITANANDIADGTITKVEFYNGTILLGTDNTIPYSYNWTNVAAGTYSITAKAYDDVNAVTLSNEIKITVNEDLSTSTSSAASVLGLVAAPTPFQTTTKISIRGSGKILSVIIYNISGIEAERLIDVDSNELIIGEHLADGMYLLQVTTSAGVATIKVIKGK